MSEEQALWDAIEQAMGDAPTPTYAYTNPRTVRRMRKAVAVGEKNEPSYLDPRNRAQRRAAARRR